MELAGRYSNPEETSRELLALTEAPLASKRTRLPRGRQRQRRLSTDEIDSLRVVYESGTTIAELATSYGIHRSTVLAQVTRLGLPRRTRRINQHIDRAAELYASGCSLAQVGRELNVDAETIRQAFMRSGIPIRPRPGWST